MPRTSTPPDRAPVQNCGEGERDSGSASGSGTDDVGSSSSPSPAISATRKSSRGKGESPGSSSGSSAAPVEGGASENLCDADSSSPSSAGGATRKSSRGKEGGASESLSDAVAAQVPVCNNLPGEALPGENDSTLDSSLNSSTTGVSDELDSEGKRVALNSGESSPPPSEQ